MEELFPLVNEQGELIGKATRAYCHSGSFVLHPVVHLHVFNPAGQLFLQKRSMSKDIQPGMWDTSVGGHVDYKETLEHSLSVDSTQSVALDALPYISPASANQSAETKSLKTPAPWVLAALQREACEELGIVGFDPVFVFRYPFRSAFECELVHSFFTIYDGPISIDPIEISEGRFWNVADIQSNIGAGLFTPNFEGEILEVLSAYKSYSEGR